MAANKVKSHIKPYNW